MRKRDCSGDDSTQQKRCGRCQKTKSVSEFGIVKRDGKYRNQCYDCYRKNPNASRVDIRDRSEKLCPGCKMIKPIAEFRKKGEGENRDATVWHYCRPCNTDVCRERLHKRIANGEAREDYKKAYQKKRWQRLLAQYGISQEQYETMHSAQNGLCAICNLPETATYKDVTCRLVVDHDHKTGKIRGLLCRACNIAIGNFREDIERLRSAIVYLKLHNESGGE